MTLWVKPDADLIRWLDDPVQVEHGLQRKLYCRNLGETDKKQTNNKNYYYKTCVKYILLHYIIRRSCLQKRWNVVEYI